MLRSISLPDAAAPPSRSRKVRKALHHKQKGASYRPREMPIRRSVKYLGRFRKGVPEIVLDDLNRRNDRFEGIQHPLGMLFAANQQVRYVRIGLIIN